MFSRQDKPSLKHPRSVIIMSITKNRKGGEDDGERRLIGSPSRNAAAPVGTFVYVLAFFSGLGGFLFGYDTGVVSGALLLLKREMNLNTLWQELVVSSTVGAAAVSSLSGGYLNGLLGRRKCTLVASFIFTIGGFIMTFAPNKEVLLVGRIIIGLGIGVGSMTLPVYIAEVSPPHMRGQLVTVITVLITAGQFSANVVDGAFSYMKRDGWRYMLGLSVVPAIGQFVGFLFLPESPRWLLQKGRHQEARRVLSRIRGCQDVDEEYDYIQSSIEEEEKGAKDGEVIFFRILRHGPTRRALIVGCGLQMFQQLTGINTVMYYSATILQMSGVRDERQAIWLSAVTSGTNFVCTSLSIWLVDRVGRRKLTLASITGTTLSLSVLSIGFLLSAQNSPAVTLRPLDSHNSSCTSYRTCSDCMLNPACGFCYRQNSSDIFDSTCLPANPTSSDHSAWGRSVIYFLFVSVTALVLINAMFLMQVLQPDGCARESNLGLQLLSDFILLGGPGRPPPLPDVFCSRNGSHAVDHQLRDLPTLGPQHWQRLLGWHQLDLQRHPVAHLPPCRGAAHLSRHLLPVHGLHGAGLPLHPVLPAGDEGPAAGGHREPVHGPAVLLRGRLKLQEPEHPVHPETPGLDPSRLRIDGLRHGHSVHHSEVSN
ncbi:proton myo-inositol cotransporter-like isoform X3 [Nerophis lumbriciformis]|uniref:proton myo-inositol cotransporter-like isoform X3 n=1 Tax=Nerophis lumbriciformis TaxID=546530 RepID=UPI002ADFAA55|nr:proton myo-inositol cotransporter-like isoform X3 [Nerophis lumbriciformis]